MRLLKLTILILCAFFLLSTTASAGRLISCILESDIGHYEDILFEGEPTGKQQWVAGPGAKELPKLLKLKGKYKRLINPKKGPIVIKAGQRYRLFSIDVNRVDLDDVIKHPDKSKYKTWSDNARGKLTEKCAHVTETTDLRINEWLELNGFEKPESQE